MRPIPRPSASMVVACLALGVALSGTAVAASVALAPNSVGTAMHMVGSCAMNCSHTRFGVIGEGLTKVAAAARRVK